MSKINYARFIGRLSAARKPSIIREMTKLLASAPKDVIPLSGGLPNPIMFPFVETVVKTSDKSTITITVLIYTFKF